MRLPFNIVSGIQILRRILRNCRIVVELLALVVGFALQLKGRWTPDPLHHTLRTNVVIEEEEAKVP